MKPYSPVARSGYLVTLKIEEFVSRHIVRQLVIVAVSHQHRREYNAVEHDIILADEVDKPGLRVFPPCLPAVGKYLLGVGDIADRSVKPYIEHLPLCTFDRHGDAPVKVAAHGAGLKPHVEP